MNFESMLRKLNAIGGMQGSVSEAKKPDADKDGIPDWADEDKKEKANEDIMKVMRGLQAIQETNQKVEEEDVEEGNEFAQKVSQLKAQGAKAGTKFKTSDGKEHVLEAEEKCSECGCTPCECDDKEEVKEAEEKCSDCGHTHTGDCKEEVEEGVMDKVKAFGKKALDTLGHPDDEEMIKDMQRKAGVPVTGKKPGEEDSMKESDYSMLRQLAGIQECGDMEMSPMTVVGGEPQMGVNPAMPAEVPTIGAQQEPEMAQQSEPQAPAATYTLSIQNGENNLQMTTDVPDEIIHIMKLAGINKGAQVSQKPAGDEQQTDEAFGNTPAQTNEPNPRLHGDIADWGQKGTGAGKPEYPGTKASGDNPMHEALEMVLEYRKFKSNK